MKKAMLRIGAAAVAVALVLGVVFGSRVTGALYGAHGFAAKWVCSEIFVSGLPPEQAVGDLPENPLEPFLRHEVDEQLGSVTLSSLGFAARTAVHRPGFGCTLLPPDQEVEDLTPVPAAPVVPAATAEAPGLVVDSDPANDPEGLDRAALDAAVAAAFTEDDPERPKNTRAVVVVHGNRLVAERYAEGFGPETPLAGWSMTKSWINALVGILVARGELDPTLPVDVPEWPQEDPRTRITLDQLLRMSSGLDFDESYSSLLGDAIQMLFVRRDTGGFALAKEPAHEPDAHWYYSSGSTNIIARSLRRSFDSHEDYLSFPRRALFEPLGMEGATLEPDPSGTFVGSSFGWATARDWARFGLLYLQDGVWNDDRLLPEGWVEYTATPTPRAPMGRYGAHFWLNVGDADDPSNRPMPEAPTDLVMADGFNGQHVVVAPSRDAVVVRLGLSQPPTTWDLEAFLVPILEALPETTR